MPPIDLESLAREYAEHVVANCACATQLDELRDEDHDTYRVIVLNVESGLKRFAKQIVCQCAEIEITDPGEVIPCDNPQEFAAGMDFSEKRFRERIRREFGVGEEPNE